ncbi:hypothetical protein GBAR_LOCUS26485, partial [Geodia barretti]
MRSYLVTSPGRWSSHSTITFVLHSFRWKQCFNIKEKYNYIWCRNWTDR